MIDPLQVVVDLGAECASREWMIGVTIEPFRLTVTGFDHPCACVRAIVSARSSNYGQTVISLHAGLHCVRMYVIRTFEL